MELVQAKVNYIFDGDTIVVQTLDSSFIARARWVDSPEVRKPRQRSTKPEMINHWEWGKRSHSALINLIAGQTITIIKHQLDIYGRTISDWYLGEVSLENCIQVQLARNGLVANSLPFQKYDFPNNDLELYIAILSACAVAKKNRLGFWSEPSFLLPYQLKKSQRS